MISVIENPIIKDRITFVIPGETTGGEYARFKLELAPHGGVNMHYHCSFTEKFEVVEGRLNISLAGKEIALEAGQSALAPLRVHHRFYNTSDRPVTCMVELRPAQQFEKALRISYGLACDGKTNARAIPTNPLHLALVAELSDTYLPGIPLFLQQGMFKVLARIARRLGKDKELKKYL